MRNKILKPALVLALAGTTACLGVGSSSITGSLGGRTIRPQTVFAFLDANHYETENGKTVLKPRAPQDQVLTVRLDGASYDPAVDMRFLDPDEQRRIGHERGLNGFLTFRVRRAGFAKPGIELKRGTGIEEAGTDAAALDFRFPQDLGLPDLQFAAQPLGEDEDYPKELTPVGSVRTITVKLDSIGKATGEITSGKIVLEWKRKTDEPKDPDNAQEGKIEIEFEAEHIGERIGKCNQNQGYYQSSYSLMPYGDESDLECNGNFSEG